MTRTAKIAVAAVLAVAVAAAVVGVVAIIAGHDGGSGWRTHQTMMQGPFGNPGPRGFATDGRSGWWWPAVLLPWFSLALVAGVAAWLLVSRPLLRTSTDGVPASTQAPASWEKFTQWHSQVHAHQAAPDAVAQSPAPEATAAPAEAAAPVDAPVEAGGETAKTD